MKTVVYVPGFFIPAFPRSLDIKTEFEKFGYKALIFDPGVNVGDIELTARDLGDFVEKACNENENGKASLLGYSLGGLISCCYFRYLGGDNRIDKIITAATPFAGMYVAYLGAMFKAGRQMIPGCGFLRNLMKGNNFSNRVISISAGNDQIIKPKSSSVLDGAKNINVPGAGHLNILESRETWKIIGQEFTP